MQMQGVPPQIIAQSCNPQAANPYQSMIQNQVMARYCVSNVATCAMSVPVYRGSPCYCVTGMGPVGGFAQ